MGCLYDPGDGNEQWMMLKAHGRASIAVLRQCLHHCRTSTAALLGARSAGSFLRAGDGLRLRRASMAASLRAYSAGPFLRRGATAMFCGLLSQAGNARSMQCPAIPGS